MSDTGWPAVFFFFIFFILAFITRSWSDLGQAIGASTSRNTTISDPEKGQFNPTIKKKKTHTNTHHLSYHESSQSALFVHIWTVSETSCLHLDTTEGDIFVWLQNCSNKNTKKQFPRCQGINREQPELCFFKDNLQLIIFF